MSLRTMLPERKKKATQEVYFASIEKAEVGGWMVGGAIGRWWRPLLRHWTQRTVTNVVQDVETGSRYMLHGKWERDICMWWSGLE
jgi:hypothetical protein